MFKLAVPQSAQEEPREHADRKKAPRRVLVIVCMLVVICSLGLFSTTAFAQGVISNVLAYFQLGNFRIVQYDEFPDVSLSPGNAEERSSGDDPQNVSLDEAYKDMGLEFALPKILPKGFQYVNCLDYGNQMVSVQYRAEDDQLGFLITNEKTAGPNGVSTTDKVETAEIDGKTVYFVNGIVIWHVGDLRYELYWAHYDMDSVRQIISSLGVIHNN